MDDIRFFHDQKSDAFFKTGAKLNTTIEDRAWWEAQERERELSAKPETHEQMAEEVRVIKDTMEKLRHAKLKQEYADDQEQKELLQKAIATAKKMMAETFHKAIEYFDLVTTHRAAKVDIQLMSSGERERLMRAVEQADRARRHCHNSLISNLHSTIRYISYTFGKIGEEAQEKWEEQQEEAGKTLLQVERQDFSGQILCPDNVDLHDRDRIKEWVIRLHGQLVKFYDEMK